MESIKDAALRYVRDYGFAVTPLNGKVPILQEWTIPGKGSTRDPEQVSAWWRTGRNVGIVTGSASGGLVVIDLDESDSKHGRECLEAWEDVHGKLPDTWEVQTGSGGRHLYFKDLDHTYKSLKDQGDTPAFSGIDIRAEGGQVVAPPSIHPTTGKPYIWDLGDGDGTEIAPADDRVRAFLADYYAAHAKAEPTTVEGGTSTAQKVPAGQQKAAVRAAARALRRRGACYEAIKAAAEAVSKYQCEEPAADPAAEIAKVMAENLTPARCQLPATIEDGTRHAVFEALIGGLIVRGLCDEAIRAAVEAVNDKQCNPPFSTRELYREIFPMLNRGWLRGQLVAPPDPEPRDWDSPISDPGDKLPAEDEAAPARDDIITAFLKSISTERYKPIPTGIKPLDDFIGGGLVAKDLIFLGAEPGSGKTTLATMICESMARAGHPVIYFNFEMDREQLLARSLSRIISERHPQRYMTPSQILRGYEHTEEQAKMVREAADIYRQEIMYRMAYNPTRSASLSVLLDGLDMEAKRCKANGRPAPHVCIDYLQLLQGDDREDAAAVIKRAVQGLKSYAMRHDAVVLCIMAQSRSVNQAGKATLSAGRDSSAIEYSADMQLQLTPADAEYPSRRLLYVTKSRSGPWSLSDAIEIDLQGDRGRFDFSGWRQVTHSPFDDHTPDGRQIIRK